MKNNSSEFHLSAIAVAIAGILWGLLSFYFGIIYGIPLPGQEKPQWYVILNYIFDCLAHLGALMLCLRNWRFPQIISNRNIWLFFGLRGIFYIVANLLYGYWELGLGRYPNVTLADPVYIVAYALLLWGMFLAVRSRRVKLKIWQYAILSAIAAIGIWLGWLSSFPSESSQASLISSTPIVEQTLVASNAASTIAQNNFSEPENISQMAVPRWVLTVENSLEPLSGPIALLYVFVDIVLLILAGALVLTFWGGQFSRTWAVIALAALLLYAADVRYAYIVARGNFETGGLLDTLWIFSVILVGVGAAMEYDLSRQLYRRRS